MAIFDANKKHFLQFFIALVDADAVNAANTTFASSPAAPNIAPLTAAITYNAPFRGYTQPNAESAPYTWTPWSGYGTSGGPYPLDVKSFSRHTGGFLGIGGTTVKYFWMATAVHVADANATDPEGGPTDGGIPIPPDNRAEIPKRRWAEGFEVPGLGASGFADTTGLISSRDAARSTGGIGLAQRGATNTIATVILTQFGAVTEPAKSWERVYVRARKFDPTQAVEFWRGRGSVSPAQGMALAIDATGGLVVISISPTSVRTVVTTVAGVFVEWNGLVTQNAWRKLDMLIEFDIGKFRVFNRGIKVVDVAMAVNGVHSQSDLGNSAGTTNDMECDLDDWVNSEIPKRASVESLKGMDFLQGSKIALVRPRQYSSNHNGGAWAGDFRVLIQNPMGISSSVATIVSTTALSLAAVDADSEISIDADTNVGVASMVVSCRSIHTGAGASGRLGFSVPSGVQMFTIADGGGVETASRVLYSANTNTAAGNIPDIPDATPIELRYEKSNDAATVNLSSLLAQAELIGMFGPEDARVSESGAAADTIPQSTGQHNAPYPRSQWAREAVAGPIAPYIVQSGTYVGNGTGQDLTFRAPPNWFFVRPLTGNTGGLMWWTTMMASHTGFGEGMNARTADAQEDLTFVPGVGDNVQQQRYRIRIAGADTQYNANGVTYQYVAVSDPGARYMHNGLMQHKTLLASFVNKLINEQYLPGFGFFWGEQFTNSTLTALYGKGPGQAAATLARFFTPTAIANAMTFGTGQLTSQAAFHALNGGRSMPYSLWRRSDGNRDTGEAAVVNFGSWIGDGTASRTVALAPATGKRPVFVMVFAESGASGYWRDPSHTGSNSSTHSGAENATGITSGGIDQFSVGSSLNGNGIVYTYFCLFACGGVGNNGWGVNGECVPVEPAPPIGGPWPPDPVDPETPIPPAAPLPGEPELDCTTLISTSAINLWGQVGGSSCCVYTLKVVNTALGRIGINKAVVNIATDLTEEAANARGVLAETVHRTLRDFPWPFATKYSNLVLVTGSAAIPANKDWTFAYRAPNNLLFVRRIVPPGGTQRRYDPNPIPFRIGTDATGGLIFTNEAIPTGGTLVVEWTERQSCPAFYGDPLFRDAWIWRLAAELAQPLARDSKKQEFCLGMYERALLAAEVPAANEGQQERPGDADWITGR